MDLNVTIAGQGGLFRSINDDDRLIILDHEGGELFDGAIGDIIGREAVCFRCDVPITSRAEVVWLDAALRNDCTESSDGAPHEPEEPT